ncbi:hypothetical protein KAU11_04900, partial [Candidatus Babeliales bacterium]|nr:hypothetical protein [Candidatus Babeliales bacterium]
MAKQHKVVVLCAFALFFILMGVCLKSDNQNWQEAVSSIESIGQKALDSLTADEESTKSGIRDSLFMESATFLKHINLELSEPETYLVGLSDLYLILDHEVLPVSQKLRNSVFATIKKAYNQSRTEDGEQHRKHVIEILEKSLGLWPDDDQEKRIR